MQNATELNLVKHPLAASESRKFRRLQRVPFAITFHPVTRQKQVTKFPGVYASHTEDVTA